MPDQTPESAATRVSLEDLIEAVSRGVTRAMLAEEDEVSGYALKAGGLPVGGIQPGQIGPPLGRPPIFVGLVVNPSSGPGGPLGGANLGGGLNARG